MEDYTDSMYAVEGSSGGIKDVVRTLDALAKLGCTPGHWIIPVAVPPELKEAADKAAAHGMVGGKLVSFAKVVEEAEDTMVSSL
jgi:hypothetical protein